MSDIEGKGARVAPSEAGAERVSMDTKLNGEKGSDSQHSTINHQLAGNGDQAESATSALSAVLPNSKKIYVSGEIHPDIRVPFREITLAPTKTISGEIEVN